MTTTTDYMAPVSDDQLTEANTLTDRIWAATKDGNTDRDSAVKIRNAIHVNAQDERWRHGDIEGMLDKLRRMARTADRRNTPARDVTGLVPTTCTRCNGEKILPEYWYVDGGTCRGCEGLGTVLVTPVTAARRARNASR